MSGAGRATDPIDRLDELTFAVGPDAAFPGRAAALGQSPGRAAFERFGDSVVASMRGDAAAALAEAVLRLEVPRELRDGRYRFASAVRAPLPMPPGLCLEFLVRLAAERLELAAVVTGAGRLAAQAAAEELVVAAYEVLGHGALSRRPGPEPRRRRLFRRR